MKNNKMKGLISVLAVCMSLSCFFTFTQAVESDDNTFATGNPSISLGTNAINNGSSYYLGKFKGTPIEWLVLDEEKANNNDTNGIFAVSKKQIYDNAEFAIDAREHMWCDRAENTCVYKENAPANPSATSDYRISRVRKILESGIDSVRKNKNNFSDLEQSAMLNTTKTDGRYTAPSSSYVWRESTDILKDDKLFLLSAEETQTKIMAENRALNVEWYLRSGRYNTTTLDIGRVKKDSGEIASKFANEISNLVPTQGIYIRPGMNLDKNKVSYTTPAGEVKSETLNTVENTSSNQVKLTLKNNDESFKNSINIDATSSITNPIGMHENIKFNHASLSNVNINYTNIVAMIHDNSGNLVYYGSVNNDVNALSTTISLPDNIVAGDYKLSLYAEDWNGINESDYASEVYETSIKMIADGTLSNLTFKDGDNIFSNFNIGFIVPTIYHEGTTFVLPNGNDITKDGFLFEGWYDNKELIGKPISYISNDIVGDMSYYAKWRAITDPSQISLYGENLNKEDIVAYGKYDNTPVFWKVLDPSTSNNNINNKALLISDKIVYTDHSFDVEQNVNSDTIYKNSDLRKRLESKNNSFRKNLDNFSEIEQNAMMETIKSDPYKILAVGTSALDMGKVEFYVENSLNKDKMFILSNQEIREYFDNDILNAQGEDLNGFKDIGYWTRSVFQYSASNSKRNLYHLMPGKSDFYSNSSYDKSQPYFEIFGVRPAFNLDKKNIAFLYANEENKSASLKAVNSYANKSWKTTLYDSNDLSTKASFDSNSKLVTSAGRKIKVNHDKLSEIDSSYTNLTVMISDESGRYSIYYGSVDDNMSSTSSTITLPSTIPVGNYRISVYAEDWNGTNETDYASKPLNAQLTIVDPTISTITYMDGSSSFNSFIEGYIPPLTYVEGIETQLPSGSNVSKENYIFEGWYDNADLSGNAITTTDESTSGNKIYYAKWSQKHTHQYSPQWSKDRYNHWHECTCGDKIEIGDHVSSDWIVDKIATEREQGIKHRECITCGYILEKVTTPVVSPNPAPKPTPSNPEKTPEPGVKENKKDGPSNIENNVINTENKETNQEVRPNYLSVLKNKKSGIKMETVNNNKIFNSKMKIIVEEASEKEVKQVQKKLDNVIKIFNIYIDEDGVRIEKIDTKIRVFIDADEYKDYRNLRLYSYTKDGSYKEVAYKKEKGKIVFECDRLDTYVITGDKIKAERSDSFPWWIVITGGIITTGIIVIIVKRKKDEDKDA